MLENNYAPINIITFSTSGFSFLFNKWQHMIKFLLGKAHQQLKDTKMS